MAGKPFPEEACEGHNPPKNNACQDKLDGAIAKISSANICSSTQLGGASAEESVLFAGKNASLSLDAQNAGTFCDSSSGAMIMSSDPDDAGFVLKCECTVGKNLGKLVHAALTCHIRMAHAFAGGHPFNEETCEETDPVSQKGGLDKFNHARDVILGKDVCPPCLDKPQQDALAASALAQVDGGNPLAYPCP